MSARHTFRRGMDRWWRRDPYFMHYMAREATAPFVASYAFVLLAGLVSLARGEEAYGTWLRFMGSTPAIVAHALLALVLAYHTLTWFEIMPKTMPPVTIRGRKVPAGWITGAGIGAAIAASLVLWALAAGVRT